MSGASQASIAAKENGAYYTPIPVAAALVRFAVRAPTDRLLDPSCGDGRFISLHPNSFGVERDKSAAALAKQNAPSAVVFEGDFFAWAAKSRARFDCAAGNPPFIRYQTFSGAVRRRALDLCRRLGVPFSGLTTSWAPFIVATASLLRPGGRMAFVVPASIGHAPHAAPLIDYLVEHFDDVRILAIRRKLFPHLSEDCWLLFAEGFGGTTDHIHFAQVERFHQDSLSDCPFTQVPVSEWRSDWNQRLRPYLLNRGQRSAYLDATRCENSLCLGNIATVGIGYVTGANDFFHLRPSEARQLSIPTTFLHATVRNGRALPRQVLSASTVHHWKQSDEPVLLLRISKDAIDLPASVRSYLESPRASVAQRAYKCRSRSPWYSVPDVRVPDFFLTYMSGTGPSLVKNAAGATCTNALHGVHLNNGADGHRLTRGWQSTYVQLSCEIEGHPLGGGMLKLEPREAARVSLPSDDALPADVEPDLRQALSTLRRWRHYEPAQ